MKNNFDFIPLVGSVMTERGAFALISTVERIKTDIYTPGRLLTEQELSEAFGQIPVLENMRDHAIDLKDAHKVVAYFDALKAFFLECPLMIIVISKQLSEKAVAEIYQFIVAEFGNATLLDVTVDPSLLGGVKIQFKGYYQDYSWNRVTIAEEFKRLFV